MAYDSKLAERIRAIAAGRKGVTEKEMFGGIAFLLDGKMFIGLAKNQLMVRVGPDRHDEALARPHVRPMNFTGRPMRGYVYVVPAGYANAPRAGGVDRLERGLRRDREEEARRRRGPRGRLKGAPRLLEEFDLGGRAGAAEHGVAVREAAEARDDVAVLLGVFDPGGQAGA